MMTINKIFQSAPIQLKKLLAVELNKYGYSKEHIHNKAKFLYAEGTAPIMLVAHLDTVHKDLPTIICRSDDGNYMMSPQGIGGDDRCGVYIILRLLDKLALRPHILFTTDEEIGGLGAMAFSTYISNQALPELKYIVEYDRKGNEDAVFYDCDNPEFTEFVTSFGFTEAWGTFSDISIVAPDLCIAAVNISSGYYNPHTEHEYVSFKDMNDIIEKSAKMLMAECGSFEYLKAVSPYLNEYKEYASSYYDEYLKVTLLPAGVMSVYSGVEKENHLNKEKEIAVDQFGNYYKETPIFHDYIPCTYGMYPLDDDDSKLCYDPENTTRVKVYMY